MRIKYVSKKKLYPAFGLALKNGERIFIRRDLPKIVQKSVLEHEKFHILDYRRLKKKNKKKQNVFWSEIKANVYGLSRQPLGAIVTLVLDLSPSRLKMYLVSYKKSTKEIINRFN